MRRVLLQLDPDPQPASFDAIVALDAGAEVVLPYGGVTPENVVPLVHGAIFTRGPQQLHHTAIFIGGSDVSQAEAIAQVVQNTFFGPMRVSVLLDPNGANTTAAAAVWCVARHLSPPGPVLVLGATGPVGSRCVRLLAQASYQVKVGSREQSRAQAVVEQVLLHHAQAKLQPVQTSQPDALRQALQESQAILAAGAAGVQLLTQAQWEQSSARVLVDLNAVPPVGIQGIDPQDKATSRGEGICYGALGVGGIKMKIHRAAIAQLFEQNDLWLDAEEVYQLAQRVLAPQSG